MQVGIIQFSNWLTCQYSTKRQVPISDLALVFPWTEKLPSRI
jgi:hypothetical protein